MINLINCTNELAHIVNTLPLTALVMLLHLLMPLK